MASIRSSDTRPELLLRSCLWRKGFRFRANYRIHATKTDIAFPAKKLVVFVDGCFWHGCQPHYRRPNGNQKYWDPKLARNRARDEANNLKFATLGWQVVRIWEHEIVEDVESACSRIVHALQRVGKSRD